MRVTVEQIDREREEELIVRCHDPGAAWVQDVQEAASGQQTVQFLLTSARFGSFYI